MGPEAGLILVCAEQLRSYRYEEQIYVIVMISLGC